VPPSAHPFFAGLAEPACRALLAHAVERTYAAGEVLFLAGTPPRGLHLVLDGHVRVVRGAGGRPHVVHEERAGGTLGEVPLFEGTTYPATAVAAAPTRCLVISREAVRAAVGASPDVALALLGRLAARVRLLVERMDARTSRSTLGRLAALAVARHGASGGAPFTLARTQQDAAEELGTVRELVVRGLRDLRARGVLGTAGRGRYVVLDEPRLRRIAAER